MREPVVHKRHLMLPVWEQKQTSVAGLELSTNGDPPWSSFFIGSLQKGWTLESSQYSLRQEEPLVGATTEKWFSSWN